MPAIEYQVVAGEKPDMLLTYEEVKHLAWELSSPALYNFVMMYETGRCTWQQAMQGAALHLARETIRQRDEIVRLVSHMPPQPLMVYNAEITGCCGKDAELLHISNGKKYWCWKCWRIEFPAGLQEFNGGITSK